MWDVRTGASAKVVEGHSDTVVDLAVDASGGSAISVGSDSKIALWFLDWDPEQPEQDLWDDRVRPFLRVFLRRLEQAG